MHVPAIARSTRLALVAAWAVAAGAGLLGATAVQANPLKTLHEQTLATAAKEAASARTAVERRNAMALEVAALNSLGRSTEALQRLDAAEADLPADQRDAELRAKVLLPLGRCDEALPAVQAAIDAKDAALRKLMGSAYQAGGKLPLAGELLLAQAYCNAAGQRLDAAVAALGRVLEPMDPSLLHYTAAWYGALRRLGAAEHPGMEASALQLPARGGHHAISLAVLNRAMDLGQAQRELQRLRLRPTDAQDAWAEVLFFAAVAAESPDARSQVLAQLDALAPFGSSEWVMARLLFAPR